MIKIFKCSASGCIHTSMMKANFTCHKNSHKSNCKPRTHVKISCPIYNCQWTGYESHQRKHLRKQHNEERTLKEIRSNSEGKETESIECSKSSHKSKMSTKKKGAEIIEQPKFKQNIEKKSHKHFTLLLETKLSRKTIPSPKSLEIKNIDEVKRKWIKKRLAEESSDSIEISPGSHTDSLWKIDLKLKYGRRVTKKVYFKAEADIKFT